MPLYDFKCPHGHEFERQCKIAEREEKIPCEGTFRQTVSDELYEKYRDEEEPLPDGLYWMDVIVHDLGPKGGPDVTGERKALMHDVPCNRQAEIFIGVHNNPGGALDHGLGSNRDAAREGRYDPLNPNRRFMAKGRGYRK